ASIGIAVDVVGIAQFDAESAGPGQRYVEVDFLRIARQSQVNRSALIHQWPKHQGRFPFSVRALRGRLALYCGAQLAGLDANVCRSAASQYASHLQLVSQG